MLYPKIVRPLLFLLSPERVHRIVYTALRAAFSLPITSAAMRSVLMVQSPSLQRNLMGLSFPNPVGLPAGFDKEGYLADGMRNLGFGFMEVGTVTPLPQPGNPRPRLFRLSTDRALINRMGLNSDGVERVAHRLAHRRGYRIPVGGNIGKNSATENSSASADYLQGMRVLYPLVDFFVINISCPNVRNLCELQSDTPLQEILRTVTEERGRQRLYRPILLKISPDQSQEAVASMVHLALRAGADGFVVANTSTNRSALATDASRLAAIGAGGLSGSPLFRQALQCVRWTREAAGASVPIIGVGGVNTGAEALEMLRAGASLIQLYTGFIYGGPFVVRRINRFLVKHANEIPTW